MVRLSDQMSTAPEPRRPVTPAIMAEHFIRVAGHPDARDAARAELETRRASMTGREFDDALCAQQIRESRAGYIPFEIVPTIYGWSLRYASGLQNFGLIAKRLTFAQALEAAQREVAVDPSNREAYLRRSAIDTGAGVSGIAESDAAKVRAILSMAGLI